MKKILYLILTLFLIWPNDSDAQWIKGFNFRDSSGYCTDPANHTYFLSLDGGGSGDGYPTTRNTVTFGQTSTQGDSRRDRDSGLDCRLAGVTFKANSDATPGVFQVDLPATGDYIFCLAAGDAFNVGTNTKIQVFDNTSGFSAITDASVAGGAFMDATGVERADAATWVSSNACVTYTFTTTTAVVKVGYGDGSTSGNTYLAHFSLEQVAADNLPILQAIGEE